MGVMDMLDRLKSFLIDHSEDIDGAFCVYSEDVGGVAYLAISGSDNVIDDLFTLEDSPNYDMSIRTCDIKDAKNLYTGFIEVKNE
jgi:hypothetical protein